MLDDELAYQSLMGLIVLEVGATFVTSLSSINEDYKAKLDYFSKKNEQLLEDDPEIIRATIKTDLKDVTHRIKDAEIFRM